MKNTEDFKQRAKNLVSLVDTFKVLDEHMAEHISTVVAFNLMEVYHEGYVAGKDGRVIGLSKLNRIVEHFGRRGAIQEQLTSAIHQAVDKICENNRGVIVTVVGTHNCVSCRGVRHQGASMITTKANGVFMENGNLAREEFFDSIKINNGNHPV